MKLNGIRVEPPQPQPMVLVKGANEYVFWFRVVQTSEFDEFQTYCPKPKAKFKTPPKGKGFYDEEDPKYIKAINEWNLQYLHFRFLKSISATEGLEWETVKLEDCSTWSNWEDELLGAGFAQYEVNLLFNKAQSTQSLTAEMIEEATASFLARQEGKR